MGIASINRIKYLQTFLVAAGLIFVSGSSVAASCDTTQECTDTCTKWKAEGICTSCSGTCVGLDAYGENGSCDFTCTKAPDVPDTCSSWGSWSPYSKDPGTGEMCRTKHCLSPTGIYHIECYDPDDIDDAACTLSLGRGVARGAWRHGHLWLG